MLLVGIYIFLMHFLLNFMPHNKAVFVFRSFIYH